MADQARDVIEACAALNRRGFALGAIDGLGGSGKSTLARRVQAERAASAIIEMDDFYRPMPEAQREGLSPREGFSRYFDWQRLRAQVLKPLRAGQTARYRPYDWERGAIGSREVVVPASGLVIVEGVYTLRPSSGRSGTSRSTWKRPARCGSHVCSPGTRTRGRRSIAGWPLSATSRRRLCPLSERTSS